MAVATDNNLTDADFWRISDLVYRHCGIRLHAGKKELVRARIAKHLRVGGFDSAAEYLAHVLADTTGRAFAELINSLCTNLTCFFREVAHFDYLAKVFLPALLERKKLSGDNRILAWSAGCSTGQEPYSLAMALLDATGDSDGWDIRILASDVSTRALRAARAGVYPKAAAQAVPPLLRCRHLRAEQRDGESLVRVSPRLQEMVRFRYLNLMESWPFSGPFDFIFCRNVMMYFDKSTQQELVNRFWGHLTPSGLLFTGHAESLTGTSHRFQYVCPTIYARPGLAWGK